MRQTNDEKASITVLAVGDELLSGEVKDTNFDYIAEKMSGIGLRITRHDMVPDDIQSISTSIQELLKNGEILIITGGLGPTTDDLTRESIASAFGIKLVKKAELESYIRKLFESFGRAMPEQNLKQAMMPEGSDIIEPAGGTAAGIRLEKDGKLVFALPGVPNEMKSMLESGVLPELKRLSQGKKLTRILKMNLFGIGESDVESRIYDLMENSPVKYGFLACPGKVMVKLTAESASPDEIDRLLENEKRKVYEILGRYIYSEGDEAIEEVLAGILIKRGLTLSAAESLTAGMVCSRIVNVPGSSNYFMGGVVAYSKEAKKNVLGIKDEYLEDGAVNEIVAIEMAKSARNLFSSDIGVSTTGVAGPSKGGEKAGAGTVCIGLAHESGTHSWVRKMPGRRDYVRNASATAALNAVRLFLIDKIETDI